MFNRLKLKRQINNQKKVIKQLEQRRLRSQAALVEAILSNTSPNDKDVEYFNDFSTRIDIERDRLKKLVAEYEAL